MLSDQEFEEAATVVARALNDIDLQTNLARGFIACAALEDAGYSLERLSPASPEMIDRHGLEALLRASLADRGMTAELINRTLDAQEAEIVEFKR